MLTIILVHSDGSCLSSETNHARNSVQNVIFVFSKYHVMSFLCHHTENFCVRHFVLEVCRTIAICVDRNRIFANSLNVTIEYTFDLAVRNVERQNVLCHVLSWGCICFNPDITKAITIHRRFFEGQITDNDNW